MPTIRHMSEVDDFHEQGMVVVQTVRSALSGLLASVAADPSQPQEIARRFGVDKSLSWKISRVIREDNVWAAAPHIPGKSGFRIFLDQIRKAGAPDASIDRVTRALEELDQFVEARSGDRESFAFMAAAANPDTAREQGEAARKLAFRGQSAMWGVKARLHLSVQFVVPRPENMRLADGVVVAGLVDFQRLRPNLPWGMARISRYGGNSDVAEESHCEALDPSVPHGAPPLLMDFCSQPMPPVNLVPVGPGVQQMLLGASPMGRTGESTCIGGWCYRTANPLYRNNGDEWGEHLVNVSTPTELVVQDVYVHKSLASQMPPQAAVYSNLPAGQTFAPSARDQGILPIFEELIPLGMSPPSMMLSEWPGYTPMVEQSFRWMKADPLDYIGYRYRLRYPPVPSIIVMRFRLLDP